MEPIQIECSQQSGRRLTLIFNRLLTEAEFQMIKDILHENLSRKNNT